MREGFQGIFYCEKSKRNFELFGLFSVLVKGFLKIPVRRMEDQKGIPDSMSRPFPAALGCKTGCGRKEWGAGSICMGVELELIFMDREKQQPHRRVKEEMHAAWNPGSGER